MTTSITPTKGYLAVLAKTSLKKVDQRELASLGEPSVSCRTKPCSIFSAPSAWWPHQNERCSKSTQLGDALKNGKKSSAVTTQTFTFALQELAATEGTESPS
jgi:hypothetical protein